ncbi:hypothetical protein K7432_017142, partial [Basidiobolus ranarum]
SGELALNIAPEVRSIRQINVTLGCLRQQQSNMATLFSPSSSTFGPLFHQTQNPAQTDDQMQIDATCFRKLSPEEKY